jgi:hypothetical protein
MFRTLKKVAVQVTDSENQVLLRFGIIKYSNQSSASFHCTLSSAILDTPTCQIVIFLV